MKNWHVPKISSRDENFGVYWWKNDEKILHKSEGGSAIFDTGLTAISQTRTASRRGMSCRHASD